MVDCSKTKVVGVKGARKLRKSKRNQTRDEASILKELASSSVPPSDDATRG